MNIRKTYRYRIYPKKSQIAVLNQTLEECRRLYNSTLALRHDAWKNDKSSISFYQTNKMLTQWKKDNLFSKQIHSKVLQNVQERVDLDLKKFHSIDSPRYKKENKYRSFTYSQSGFSLVSKKRLRLSKIGMVKIKLHRHLEGDPKKLTVRKSISGKWYVCFEVDQEIEPLVKKDKISVGIFLYKDRWIKHDSWDRFSPHCALKEHYAHKQVKDDFSARNLLDKYQNVRRDYFHKIANELTEDYSFIFVSKEGGEWNEFLSHLEYKAEIRGVRVVLVDVDHSCGKCGAKTEGYQCSYCDRWVNVMKYRDVALNALRNGLKKI